MQQQEFFYQTLKNNQKIHYRDIFRNSQKEQTIVLIHGNYSTLNWWDIIVNELRTEGYRIIAPDLRGFGKSSYNNTCSRYRDWAQDVIELCHILGIKKIIVNGWSFGGAISMKIADLAPQMVSKIILTCSVPAQDFLMKNEQGKVLKQKDQIIKNPKIAAALQILKDQNKVAMRQIFQFLLYEKMGEVEKKIKDELAESPFFQRCYPDLLVALANSDINSDNIKAKTLLIHGNEDKVIHVNLLMQTAQKLGKLQIWQNNAHMIPLEDTSRYITRIKQFIKN